MLLTTNNRSRVLQNRAMQGKSKSPKAVLMPHTVELVCQGMQLGICHAAMTHMMIQWQQQTNHSVLRSHCASATLPAHTAQVPHARCHCRLESSTQAAVCQKTTHHYCLVSSTHMSHTVTSCNNVSTHATYTATQADTCYVRRPAGIPIPPHRHAK